MNLVLFGIYWAIYTAFVFLSAFRPSFMEILIWDGIPVSVVYGMGLIIGAFVFALFYCWLCRERSS